MPKKNIFAFLKSTTIVIKVYLAVALISIVNIGLFVYQVINLKISLWNIIPTVLVVYVVVINLKNMTNEMHKKEEILLSDLGTVAAPKDELKNESVDDEILKELCPTKLTKVSIIIKVVFMIIFIVLTVVFNNLYSRLDYDQLVKGEIIDTTISGSVDMEISGDGVTSSDNRELVMIVEYEMNGEIYKIEITDTFSQGRTNSDILLCVKDDGEFVRAYDNIISYTVMFYTCVALLVLMVVGFILKFPSAYLVSIVAIFAGMGFICLFNSFNWEFWLLKDFTVFGACFLTMGIVTYINLIILKIISVVKNRKSLNKQFD